LHCNDKTIYLKILGSFFKTIFLHNA